MRPKDGGFFLMENLWHTISYISMLQRVNLFGPYISTNITSGGVPTPYHVLSLAVKEILVNSICIVQWLFSDINLKVIRIYIYIYIYI